MTINRRKFFAQAFAFVAALFTPKPKTPEPVAPGQRFVNMSAEMWPKPTPSTCFFIDFDGNLWEFGPQATKIWTPPEPIPTLNFSRDAFTFATPKLTEEEADRAFDEVNRMIDRWASEPLFPKIEHTSRIQS